MQILKMEQLVINMIWGSTAFMALAAIVGAMYEMMSRRRISREFPPFGKLVDIGGRRIQFDARGAGSPTVVFEAGMDIGGSLSWSAVHDEIAKTTRACAYSRAGIMWSDPKNGPQNGKTIAEELHAVLTMAGEKPPFVLVGHSAGGPYIMTYTKYFGSDVAGLVFVDASHPEQELRLKSVMPASGSKVRALLDRMRTLFAWAGILRITLAAPVSGASHEAIVHAYAPTSIGSISKENAAWGETLAEAGTFRELGNRPIYVLTSMAPMPEEALTKFRRTRQQDIQAKEIWKKMHEEQALWSSQSQHQLVFDAHHYIQFDRPDVVVAAVESVVNSIRGTSQSA